MDYTSYIEQKIQYLPLTNEPQGLFAPIKYALESGGKRLRPTLLLATVDALNGNLEKAVPQALAVEVFHNFTLLHDDVMDNADTRRGRPTVHRRWDENTAILSGDAMLTLSTQLVAQCDDNILPKILKTFNQTAMDVYKGQQLDMDFEHRNNVSHEEYIEMIRLKTSVLLGGSCAIGAICAGANNETTKAFYEYGVALGLAFQLKDDLLDTFGDPIVFGKEPGTDILNKKKTWLWIQACALDKSGVMTEALQTPTPNHETVAKVSDLYRNLLLDKEIEKLISEYSQRAVKALDKIQMSQESRSFFVSLTNNLANRVS